MRGSVPPKRGKPSEGSCCRAFRLYHHHDQSFTRLICHLTLYASLQHYRSSSDFGSYHYQQRIIPRPITQGAADTIPSPPPAQSRPRSIRSIVALLIAALAIAIAVCRPQALRSVVTPLSHFRLHHRALSTTPSPQTPSEMQLSLRKSETRGGANHGWLKVGLDQVSERPC